VLQISANLLNRPGPRIIDGLEVLTRLLHPDVFAGGTP
jgi:iron complex transport system substrate-binding protein